MMMATLPLVSRSIENTGLCVEFPCLYFVQGPLAGKFLRSSYRKGNGFWLNDSEVPRKNRNKFCINAKIKKGRKHDYPWPDDIDPNINNGHLTYLSYFKPLTEKPKPVTLPFEKPLVDLEKKIIEIRNLADETGLDFSDQIDTLEKKYQLALKDLYTHLTPIQRLSIARHPNRPTILDHILNITEKWVELHGDRAGYDDPAIVTGIGSIEGKSYMCIGHQKGRNTKENISRNFAMPTPHGYRKALRMMKYADHHNLPILTFVDTPGAFADLKSEELGQGQAIAHNLRTMFGLKVPIVTVVTGEGGSGGALAIACANKMFMMENSAFYVASPEACAAILWKSSQAAPKAAEKLRITAQEHYKLKIADGIIPEPLGGAHADPAWASQQIKFTIIQAMKELENMNTEELLHHRMLKYRHIGGFQEGIPIDPQRKRKMKPSETVMPKTSDIESELDDLKTKILEAKSPSYPITVQAIEKLKRDVDQEITNAFISMGLQEKVESAKLELSKAPNGLPSQLLNRDLKEKVDKIMQEFKQNLWRPSSYLVLKQKLEKLNMVSRLIEQKKKNEELKAEINNKIPAEMKAKLKQLKNAWDRISHGDPVDKDLVEQLEQTKKELVDVLKTANLNVIRVTKRTVPTPPADLRAKVVRLNEAINKEIKRAVDVAGLGAKIEELKANVTAGSGLKDVERVEAEIRGKILDALDASALKEKVESLRMELTSSIATDEEGKVGADNGRF